MRRRMMVAQRQYPWDYRVASLSTNVAYNQYIDTLLPVSGGYRCTLSVVYHRLNSDGSYNGRTCSNVLSSAQDTTSVLRFGLQNINTVWQFQWAASGSGSGGFLQRGTIGKETLYEIEYTITNGKQELKCNNEVLYSFADSGIGWLDSPTLHMFDYVQGTSAAGRCADMTLYGSVKYWRYGGETLTAELVPCVKDGETCYYDVVRKIFIRNLGGGSFTPGARVNDDGTPITA